MITRPRLHLPLAATLLLLLLTLVASPAHADTQYQVSLCGYGAPDTLATTFANLDAGPEALSPCYVVDPGSGEQPGGAYLGSVWTAPPGEAITGVITAYDNIYSNTGGGEDGWVSGIAVNISGNYGQYLGGGVPNCLTGGACNNYQNGGVEVTGLDASNLGILLVCELGGCIDAGGTGVYADGLVAIVDDPNNTPAINASGSLYNAADGDWISGLQEGSSLSMNFSASDPSSVCTMDAGLTNSSGTVVASDAPAINDPYNPAYPWYSGQPCAIGPSGSFSPNLSSLATGTYYLNVNAHSAQNQEAQTAGGWLTGSGWSQGRVLRVDNSPPTGTVTASGNANTWYGTPQTVTVNASDVGSGVDSVDCTGPGAPSSAIPASQLPYTITVGQTGSDTISCDAVDNTGNVASIGSATVKVDQTPPSVTITSNTDSSTWYSSPSSIPTVTVASTTGPSGVASISCEAPGVSDTLTSTSGTLDLSSLRDGADTISCTAMSPAGLQGPAATLLVRLDSQTPTVSFAGPASQSKWYSSAASIPELDTDATTGPSGLASIDCSGDGIPSQSATVSGGGLTLTGLQPGSGAVTCTATSGSGLTSAPQAFTLNLDSAQPSAAWQTSQAQTTWYPSTASVPALTLSASPGGPSGVDHITCTGDGFSDPVTINGTTGTLHPTGFADGVNTIRCVPYSGAGVAGAPITRTVLVDSTAPAVALSGTDSSTWYRAAHTVTADASGDTNPSGVQSISCSVDGGSATVTNADQATQAVSGDGVHTATCRALSGAGVAGSASTTTVRIDTQTPAVTQTVVPASPSDPPGTVDVLVTAAEPNLLSGIASTSCSLDHQPASVVAGDKQTVTVASAGQHTLDCTATTGAGVTSTDSTQSYNVAADPGQFSLQYGTVPAAWQAGPVTVPVQLTGATASNYSSLTCTVNGADPTTINGTSGSIDLTNSGTQQVACYATANNGADTAALTQTVQIDNQTPAASWSQSSTPAGEQVTVLGSEQTPLSGIASESCSVDGGTAQTTDTPRLTITLDSNGAHQIDCTVVSGAGLTAHVSHTVNVSVPVPAPSTVSAPDPGRWYHAAQRILLGIPADGPTITTVVCTQAGVTTRYPVAGATVSVSVPAPGGDVRCVAIDSDAQQSAAVDFPFHIDTGAPNGYFTQTGPTRAIASVSNQGGSGIQSVAVQYQIGSRGWVTLPGSYDASSGAIAVSLPAALQQPGVRYALQAIAVNNAGGRTIITTMKDGTPATGAGPATAAVGAAVSGGLYVGGAPPDGSVSGHAHALTVNYGQSVNLAGTLSVSAGDLAGQRVSIVERGPGILRRLVATTQTDGRFIIKLGAGPSRTVTYTVDGVSHTLAIRVRGKLTVTVGAASRRLLTVAAKEARGRVAYRLQRRRHGRWETLGGIRRTDRRGHASVHLSPGLAGIPRDQLRVVIESQPTWPYLPARRNA